MQDKPTLLLCPFCEAAPDITHKQSGHDLYINWTTIACDCVAHPKIHICCGPGDSREECVKCWNARPIEDALRAEIELLKARLEAAEEMVAAQQELLDARNEEIEAAVRHDDYHEGGKIHTKVRLDVARERVLKACSRGSAARAKWESLK